MKSFVSIFMFCLITLVGCKGKDESLPKPTQTDVEEVGLMTIESLTAPVPHLNGYTKVMCKFDDPSNLYPVHYQVLVQTTEKPADTALPYDNDLQPGKKLLVRQLYLGEKPNPHPSDRTSSMFLYIGELKNP
jgi:hypothetical protein